MTDITESQQHNETDVVMAAEWGFSLQIMHLKHEHSSLISMILQM